METSLTPVELLVQEDEAQMCVSSPDLRGDHGQSQPPVAAEAAGSPWCALYDDFLHLDGATLRHLC